MRTAQPSSTSGPSAYQSAFSSSPALYQSRTVPETTSARRQSEISSGTDSSYAQSFRRISNPYDSSSSSQYSMTSGQTIPSISGLTQSPLPSPHLGANSSSSTLSSYSASLSRLVSRESFENRQYMSLTTYQITWPLRLQRIPTGIQHTTATFAIILLRKQLPSTLPRQQCE